MSYRIQYKPELHQKYPKQKIHKILSTNKLLCTVSIILFVFVFIYNGWHRSLLPGHSEVTKSAISNLVKNIEEGEPVKNAIYIFYEEVITEIIV